MNDLIIHERRRVRNGEELDVTMREAWQGDGIAQRMRNERLTGVRGFRFRKEYILSQDCRNCAIYDLLPALISDQGNYTVRVLGDYICIRSFQVLHEHTKVQFFDRHNRLTPYGLRLVEPLYKSVCANSAGESGNLPRALSATLPKLLNETALMNRFPALDR